MNDEFLDLSTTKKSKIVKYKLEEDVVMLRQSGMSYQQIADELNESGKVPEDDELDKYVVLRFLEKLPKVQQQIVSEDRRRLVEVVNTNLDIVHEVTALFGKTKALLNHMEEDAFDRGKAMDPYRFKAVASEMREMLKQMTEIQREINDYNNIRKFMEIVLNTLKEECPEKIPVISEKLKMTKGTTWFSDMMGR
ncbi:hypothetical protein [Peribacillus frigoritolerans]|uniref:DUF3486 family protein n=1 Tax=Peribacillus castrilensis TaxID=2897690 RepID=A0AAW9NP56_9BACI|nr:hypothetical protein [Peribacillus castrilensis]